MGNQLLKGYTLQGEPVSGVGCQKMWRIYQGIKQNTNSPATIFAIEKKSLPKGERQQLIQFAKKQAMSLARIRHPGVLAISQTLIEDQLVMAFSTEQVQGSLAMLAKQNKLKQIISNEIQLRLNLFPLLDTIQFLHENVKTAHLSINFDNIYIAKDGKWKISGFSNSHVHSSEGLEDLKNYRCSNYSSSPPQIVTQKKFQKKSDVHSFGILILDLLLVLVGKYEPKVYKTQSQYTQSFESDLLKKLNNEHLEKLQNYRQLKNMMKNVLARDVSRRASLHQLSSSKWLNDKLVLTVRYLQNITNYDNKQQIQFLKGLLGILSHFQPKILLRKILPLLLDLLKFKHLIPSVVFICLQTIKNGKIISQTDFRQKIWPSFRKVVQGKQMTAHSLYLFVDNIQKIQKVVGIQQLTQCIIPLYIKCFDCPPKLKQLALIKTDYILNKMDYQFVKAKMIPKVMNCIKDQNSDIHKKGLIALRKSIKILDNQTITSLVLPGLEACKKSGSDPFINAITVSIYTMLGKTLPSETLCAKLIPTILPFLSDPNVGPQDFYNYKNALMTMIQKIEGERKKFWDDSHISQGTGFTEKDFEFEDQSKKSPAPQSNIGKGDYNFLSNYNKSNQGQNRAEQNQIQSQSQSQQRQQSQESKKQLDFNFSSPWGFDESPKLQHGNQATPQMNMQNNYTGNMGQTGMNFTAGFGNEAISPQIRNKVQNPSQNSFSSQYKIQDSGFGSFNQGSSGLTNLSAVSTGGFSGGSGMGNLPAYGNDKWSINKNQTGNQPISPESRQMPRLKGPDMPKQRRPQPQQYLDPWASIQLSQSTSIQSNSSNAWSNQTQAGSNYSMQMNTPMNTQIHTQPHTQVHTAYTNYGAINNSNTNKQTNLYGNNMSISGMGGNMSGSMSMGNTNLFGGGDRDDPFADLEKNNDGFNMGMSNSNFGTGSNYGGNTNLNMNVSFGVMGQGGGNQNQFNYGQNMNSGVPSNFSQNTGAFNMMSSGNPQKSTGANSFDLI